MCEELEEGNWELRRIGLTVKLETPAKYPAPAPHQELCCARRAPRGTPRSFPSPRDLIPQDVELEAKQLHEISVMYSVSATPAGII